MISTLRGILLILIWLWDHPKITYLLNYGLAFMLLVKSILTTSNTAFYFAIALFIAAAFFWLRAFYIAIEYGGP